MTHRTGSPRIGIGIPCYNYGHLLVETIEGVLNQSFSDFEIVIADNCSTDDTAEIACRYAAQDSRIRYVCNDSNLGYIGNVNRLLEELTAPLITILAADDCYLETSFLDEAVHQFDQSPDLAMFHTAYMNVDDTGKHLSVMRWNDQPVSGSGYDEIERILGGRIPWLSSMVTTRAAISVAGGMSTEFGPHGDYGWCLNLALQGSVYYSPRASVSRRLHDISIGGTTSKVELLHWLLQGMDRFKVQIETHPELLQTYSDNRRALVERIAREGRGDIQNVAGISPRVNEMVETWIQQERRLLIYGAGDHTRDLFQMTNLRHCQLLAVCDRDPAKRGQMIEGLPVISPEEIYDHELDGILISSNMFQEQIAESLAPHQQRGIELIRLYPGAAGGSIQ